MTEVINYVPKTENLGQPAFFVTLADLPMDTRLPIRPFEFRSKDAMYAWADMKLQQLCDRKKIKAKLRIKILSVNDAYTTVVLCNGDDLYVGNAKRMSHPKHGDPMNHKVGIGQSLRRALDVYRNKQKAYRFA